MCKEHNQTANTQKSEQRSKEFLNLLKSVRGDTIQGLSNKQTEQLLRLKMNGKEWTTQMKQKVINNPRTIFLFANNDDKDEFNFQSLKKINSSDNPVTIIRSINEGSCSSKNQQHFDETRNPKKDAHLCRMQSVTHRSEHQA